MGTKSSITRRTFLRCTVSAVGLCGMAGKATVRAQAAHTQEELNPFAYDVSRLAQTDPKLIQYEEVGRFHSPHDGPRRIATGPSGQIYLAAGNYVSVVDAQGTTRLEIGLSSRARCVAAAPEGDIYVGLRDHVEVYDAKGQRRAAWESPGPRTWFTALAVTKNGIFAADAGNRVVLRYDADGKLSARFGAKNKSLNTPGFIVPSPFFDLGMHPDGLLRVTNPGRHRVEAYTPNGNFEFAWGKPSAAIEGFCGCCNPVNIAVLPDGKVVTCEKGLPRVKVYSEGVLESVVAGPESFSENAAASAKQDGSEFPHAGLDAAADAAGRIYVLDLVTADVRVMTRKSHARGSAGNGSGEGA